MAEKLSDNMLLGLLNFLQEEIAITFTIVVLSTLTFFIGRALLPSSLYMQNAKYMTKNYEVYKYKYCINTVKTSSKSINYIIVNLLL